MEQLENMKEPREENIDMCRQITAEENLTVSGTAERTRKQTSEIQKFGCEGVCEGIQRRRSCSGCSRRWQGMFCAPLIRTAESVM